ANQLDDPRVDVVEEEVSRQEDLRARRRAPPEVRDRLEEEERVVDRIRHRPPVVERGRERRDAAEADERVGGLEAYPAAQGGAKPPHSAPAEPARRRVKPGIRARGRHAAGYVDEVLDRYRDAVKRPAVAALRELARRPRGRLTRLGGENLVVGVEPRVVAFD